MVKMGFATDEASNSESNERVLLYDIWRILGGDQKDEIPLDDLKVIIMAILKIPDDKRISLLNTESIKSSPE